MFEVLLGAFGVTVLTSLILFGFFKSKVIWWEIVALLVISLLVGATFKWIAASGMSKDIEYWTTRFERVEYYEKWDEWIDATCYESCNCITDKDGYTSCDQCPYDCSYRDYHRAYWMKIDHLGRSYKISQSEYNRLKRKMDNSTFKDMRRDYDLTDGDMYYTSWNRDLKDYEAISTEHTYENKTQAVPNIFNYVEVDSFDLAEYKLFPYTQPNSIYYQKHILGYNDKVAEHQLQILNGELGDKKQVKMFIIVFKNQPIHAGTLQESYWKGGNKNEIVITMSIDDKGKPQWCMPFSWSEKEGFKVRIRNFVNEQEKLDLTEVVNFSYNQIVEDYERKEFADFEYLEVKLSTSQVIWSIVVSLIVNILFSVFIVHNQFEDGWNDIRNYSRRRFRNYK